MYIAVDIETSGLKPWEDTINSIHSFDGTTVRRHNPDQDLLDFLKGNIIWFHNAMFDVSFLSKYLNMHDLDIRDTMLLAKWVNNSNEPPRTGVYSLAALCTRYRILDYESFAQMKLEENKNEEYWQGRGDQDVIYTWHLAKKLSSLLPEEQRLGFTTEQAAISVLAEAYYHGVPINEEALVNARIDTDQRIAELEHRLSPHITTKQIRSPQQLSKFLYEDMNLTAPKFTPKGAPSADAEALKILLEDAQSEVIRDIIGVKTLYTIQSKYLKDMPHVLHGRPAIFGTYTGRLTMASKIGKERTSIALHQLPRESAVRSILVAPEGYKIYSADASGQESRLMCVASGDPMLTKIFNEGIDFHKFTGDSLGATRQLGKVTNLSNNYRISPATFQKRAFSQHNLKITEQQAYNAVYGFKRTYRGVVDFWDNAIYQGFRQGYAKEFGGRRVYLKGREYQDEQVTINFPIQSAGASMKYIGIKAIKDAKLPIRFMLDVHDQMCYFIPEECSMGIKNTLDAILNNLEYKKYWGFTPEIPMPWDSGVGRNFKEVK